MTETQLALPLAPTSTPFNERIRQHIKACGAKFGNVVFIKKDGSVRRLTFQMAAMPSRVKGTGTEAALKRQTTRPELCTVYDVHKHGFRSVDLSTVLTVKAGGTVTRYRSLDDARRVNWSESFRL